MLRFPMGLVELERCTEKELDLLSFGVIEVDADGTILSYNAAESRISGLARERVLGLNFFTEVAPCAGMPSFYTRFANGMRRGSFGLHLVYTFTFRRRPILVEVVAGRESERSTAWIQIRPIRELPEPIDRAIEDFIEARSGGQAEEPDIAAVDRCAREPIRRPSAIQPHGGMLVLDAKSGGLVAWGENIGEYLRGTSLERGAGLAEVFPELAEALDVSSLASVPEGVPYTIDRVRWRHETFGVRAHRSGAYLIVEFEHVLAEPRVGRVVFDSHRARVALEGAGSIEELASMAANFAATISGFDRALVYRFLEDGVGVALGEHRSSARLPSLVGLHFPESDIPAQARALYLESPLRHIPNNGYHPVALVDAPAGSPSGALEHELDLGLSELRSSSPFHRAYHRNMGVDASFSASIKLEGELWGLLLGHHAAPLHLTATVRRALSDLARAVEFNLLRLKGVEAQEPADHLRLRQRIAERAFAQELLSVADLLGGEPGIGELFGASGVAVIEGEEIRSSGTLPPKSVLYRLQEHMASLDRAIYMTGRVATDLPELAEHARTVAGVLGVSLGSNAELCVLWIRREEPEEVAWGGAPSKDAVEVEGRRFLLPRRSFERWVETRRGIARPWPAWVGRSVLDLRQLILTALAHHARAAIQRNLLQWQLTQARTTYLSTMSHELRTPLSAILGIIETTDTTALPEAVRDDLDLVKQAAGDLNRVIDDVLDYARLEVGDSRDQFHPERSDLDETLCRAVDLLRPRAAERGLRLSFDAVGTVPPVEIDSRRVAQVIGQLVLNAIKYTDEGEIRVLRELIGPEQVRIEVVDTGVGLEGTDVDALFEAFSRASLRKHSCHRPGSGLGLAVSRAIVATLGGEIGAHGNPTGGSTFWVQLPVRFAELPSAVDAPVEPPPTAAEPPPTVEEPRHLEVLLAEDTDVNRMIMARMLEEAGCSVTEVASGAAAVEAASSKAFDALVFDLHMPGGDGPDALAEIRGAPGPSRGAPALLVTADVDVSALDDAARAEFSAVLVKPVDIDELCGAVREATSVAPSA